MIFSTKIEFSRVYLKRFELEHITDDYLSWLNDKKLMKYSNQQYFCHTNETSRNYLMSAEKERRCLWGIWDKKDCKMLGTFSSTMVAEATVDQGILIGDSNKLKGLSFEVWNGMTTYSLHLPQIKKISAGCYQNHTKMINLLHKSNFSYVGAGFESVAKNKIATYLFEINKTNG